MRLEAEYIKFLTFLYNSNGVDEPIHVLDAN